MNISPRSLSRREAVQRMLGRRRAAAAHSSCPPLPTASGRIGRDPNLHAKVIPWDRVLTEAEMKTVTVLADTDHPGR